MSDKSKIWNSLRVYSAELKPVESFTYDDKDLRYTGLFLLYVFFTLPHLQMVLPHLEFTTTQLDIDTLSN